MPAEIASSLTLLGDDKSEIEQVGAGTQLTVSKGLDGYSKNIIKVSETQGR